MNDPVLWVVEPQLLFWPQFFLWLASFLITDYFRESLPEVTPAGLGDFQIPTATEGRFVPLVFGTVQIKGPNVTWYGDFVAEELTVTTGIVFKRDETVGFRYHLGLQLGLCRGKIAGIRRVWLGDDVVWTWAITGSPEAAASPGVLNNVMDIDRNDLFGGSKNGGGFQGRLRFNDGDSAQQPDTYLAGIGVSSPEPTDRITNLPAYRGYGTLVISNITKYEKVKIFTVQLIEKIPAETRGAVIGETNTLRNFKFELQSFSTVADGGLGDDLGLGNDHHIIGDDLNPICLAYDAFTNTDWGRGLSASDINIDNFKTAAEQIYDEGLGFSMIVDTVQKVSKLLDTIEQHIDGYIGPNPVTGRMEVNLARQDYTLASEFQADATNIIGVNKYSRSEGNQTFNELRVQYSDRGKQYNDTYAPAQDLANLIIQGRPRSKTNRYPGVHTADIANRIVWRDLRGMSRSLASVSMTVNRSAWELRPGDVLSFTDDEVGVVNLPMRITAIRQGDPINNEFLIDAVEDIFGEEWQGFSAPPPTEFIPPNIAALALQENEQLAMEAPFIINQNDPDFPDAYPRLFTAIMSRFPVPLQYDVNVDQSIASSPSGFDVEGTVINNATTVGALRNAQSGWQDGNGTFSMTVDILEGSAEDLIGAQAPGGIGSLTGVAVISPGDSTEEWILIQDIEWFAESPQGAAITLTGVYRAGLDTAMHPHLAGARIWFIWTGGTGIVEPTFGLSNTLDVKLLPGTQASRVELTDSPVPPSALPVVIDTAPRFEKPLLPVALQLNGVNFPTGDVSFETVSATNGSPNLMQGILGTPTYRWFRVRNVIWQVQGLDLTGQTFEGAEVTDDSLRVSWWLYDLDDTPSPTRGVDEIASVTDTLVLTANDEIQILKTLISAQRASILPAEAANTFNARLEIETSHNPIGYSESPENFRVSREPLFFDFTATGVFVVPPEAIQFQFRFNGEERAYEFYDLSANNATVGQSGDAHTDTDLSVFGGSSAKFIGDVGPISNSHTSGIHMPIPVQSPEFSFNDSWTVEFRARFDSGTPADDRTFCSHYQTSGQFSWQLWLDISLGQFKITYSTNGSGVLSFAINAGSPGWKPSPTLTTWYAIAVTKQFVSGTTYLYSVFVDGAFLGSTSSSAVWFDSTEDFSVGGHRMDLAPGSCVQGNMDEFRFTQGFALYGLDYVLDTDPFPTSFDTVSLYSSFKPWRPSGGLIEDSIHRETWQTSLTTHIVQDNPYTPSPEGPPGFSMQIDGVATGVAFTQHDMAYLANMTSRAPEQFSLTGDFTMEIWVKFITLASPENGQVLMSRHDRPNGSDWTFRFTVGGSLAWEYGVTGLWQDGNNNGLYSADLISGMVIDTWYHCAFTRIGDAGYLWFDGDLVAEDAIFFQETPSGSPPDKGNPSNSTATPVALGSRYEMQGATSTLETLHGRLAEPLILRETALYDPANSTSPITSPITYNIPTEPYPMREHYGIAAPWPTDTDVVFHTHWEGGPGSPAVGAVDVSTFGRAITTYGGVSLDTSFFKFGPASMRFTGADGTGSPWSIAHIPDDAIWDIDNIDFTMETQVAFASLPTASPEGYATFFGQWVEISDDRVFRFGYNGATSSLSFQQSDDGGGGAGDLFEVSAPWTPTLSPLTFHHVAAVRKNGWIFLFADGVLLGTGELGTIVTPSVSRVLSFGAAWDGSTQPHEGLDGWLDETRLTFGVAQWVMDFTPPVAPYDWHRTIFMPGPDYRGTNFPHFQDYSPVNASLVSTGGVPGYRDGTSVSAPAHFRGPSEYPDVSFNPLCYIGSATTRLEFTFNAAQALTDEEWTIELWINGNVEPSGIIQGLMGQWETSGDDRSWALLFNNGLLEFAYTTLGTAASEVDLYWPWPVQSPEFGEWHHIAIVRDHGVSPHLIRAYVDGVELVSASPGQNEIGTTSFFTVPNDPIIIGNYTDSGLEFNGNIEDPRIILGKAIYSGNFTPPTKRHDRLVPS